MRESWTGRGGFVWAAAGAAIGLGNIWRFPFLTGKYGGGAFLLLYLLCLILLGIPMLTAELALGRHTGKNPVDAIRQLASGSKRSRNLTAVLIMLGGVCCLPFFPGYGILLLLTAAAVYFCGWTTLAYAYVAGGLIFLGVYATTSGCTISYLIHAVRGTTPQGAGSFWNFLSESVSALTALSSYLLLCALIVCFGVRKGIERVSKVLVPLMLPLLILLALLSLGLPGSGKGLVYFLYPDFSKITGEALLAALGQCMLSLSLGLGINIAYGSYMPKKLGIPRAALTVAMLDLLVSILGGLIIFPAAAAVGIAPDSGPGLIFETVPALIANYNTHFHHMALISFFLMLAIAAVTSGIGSLEVAVSFLTEHYSWERTKAVLVSLIPAFGIGGLCAYGGLDWKRFPDGERLFAFLFGKADGSLFLFLDHFGGSFYLPLGGLLIVIFIGWVWGGRSAAEALAPESSVRVHLICGRFLKYMLPLLLSAIFIHALAGGGL